MRLCSLEGMNFFRLQSPEFESDVQTLVRNLTEEFFEKIAFIMTRGFEAGSGLSFENTNFASFYFRASNRSLTTLDNKLTLSTHE